MSGFSTTSWSTVLLLESRDPEERAQALSKLCSLYWQPIYLHIRRKVRDHDQTIDLTQEFFLGVIDRDSLTRADASRGRFRTFLLTLVDRFLANEWKFRSRIKRGGHVEFIPAEALDGIADRPLQNDTDPTLAFDRDWARTIIERAKRRVQRDYAKRNREGLAVALLPRILDAELEYGDLAHQFGLSQGSLKVAVHRMRRRLGREIRAIVRETVADPSDVEEELRHLIAASSRL